VESFFGVILTGSLGKWFERVVTGPDALPASFSAVVTQVGKLQKPSVSTQSCGFGSVDSARWIQPGGFSPLHVVRRVIATGHAGAIHPAAHPSGAGTPAHRENRYVSP
jgi:hypothetical protein